MTWERTGAPGHSGAPLTILLGSEADTQVGGFVGDQGTVVQHTGYTGLGGHAVT